MIGQTIISIEVHDYDSKEVNIIVRWELNGLIMFEEEV